jgi:hypothetical protein
LLLAAHSLGARAVGIEVNRRLAVGSQCCLARLGIDVINDDANDCDWPPSTHIVCAWTCFDDHQRASLAERFKNQPGTIVTTTFGIHGAIQGPAVATTAGWLSSWQRRPRVESSAL